jgi:hypothetical protein
MLNLDGKHGSSSHARFRHSLAGISSKYFFALGDNSSILCSTSVETRRENVVDKQWTNRATFFPANFSVFLAMWMEQWHAWLSGNTLFKA